MYLDFFKLKEMPFRLAPEPRFVYWSAGHAAALACMRSAQARAEGRAIIIADKGAGKTTLLEYLLLQVPRESATRFDFPPRSMAELNALLTQNAPDPRHGTRLVVCDNAHLFSEPMLAALLSGDLSSSGPAHEIRIVLAGEPPLARVLDVAGIRRAGRSAIERFQLPPLAPTEVSAYIAHRLAAAGGHGERIFRDDICVEIYRETKGNPRLVNALCDAAMVIACERESPTVGPSEIMRGMEDVGRLAAAQRNATPSPVADSEARMASDLPPLEADGIVLAKLRLLHQGKVLLERELPRGRLRVGRGSDNDLAIECKFVSRHHCQIFTSERMCVLEEVRSTNGVYVNQHRVRHRPLRDGDIIQVGEHQLHYVDLRGGPSGAV